MIYSSNPKPTPNQRVHRIEDRGQCVPIEQSYFSHCGGGGYWEQNRACGGVPESYLRYTIGYEENRENYDRHLCHNDGSNWHDWRESQVNSNWQYAMCTGGTSMRSSYALATLVAGVGAVCGLHAAAAAAGGVVECTAAHDCYLNGVCSSTGECTCNVGWKGKHCGK